MAKEKSKKNKVKKENIEETIKADVTTSEENVETENAVDPNPIENACDTAECKVVEEDIAPDTEDECDEPACNLVNALTSISDHITSKKLMTLARMKRISDERTITISLDPPKTKNHKNHYSYSRSMTAAEMRIIADYIIPPEATNIRITQNCTDRIVIKYTVSMENPCGTVKDAKKIVKQTKKLMNDAYGKAARSFEDIDGFCDSDNNDSKTESNKD